MKVHLISAILVCMSLLASASDYDIVVAQDGSGDYTTVQEAVTACGAFPTKRKVVFIKNGRYKEKVLIDTFHANLTLLGESRDKTIITFDDYSGKTPEYGTFNSYTMKVMGDDIILENLTVENSSGEVGQAVALHAEGDKFKVVNCKLLGHQDTLYAAGKHSRQHYTNCFIAGTTDYIFGSAVAVFDNCELHSLRNSYVTAANTPEGNRFGYVFFQCKLTATKDVDRVYLGRPWRDFANVVFIDCEMGAHIVPEGWHNWGQPNREKTAFYAEYHSKGKGAAPEARVSWSHQLTKEQASTYKLDDIYMQCESWKVAD
ncbi:MAG: pectinesterase family protein [Mangrovibacterium sp.]